MIAFLLLFIQLPLAHASFCEEQLAEQQLRIEAASTNLHNAETSRTPDGGPFKPQRVVCGLGPCSIQSEMKSPKLKYQPSHPDADANGYVALPNIDLLKEETDLKIAQIRFAAIRQQCD